MYIEQMYTNCLAEAAYYIESEGEAAIIDPIRETEPYTKKAQERNSKIKYIFETHFHADFVSGHIDLAKKTGAKIVFGPMAKTAYDTHTAKDGEIFQIGKIKIKVMHTPGHTPESSCYLLIDENGKENAIFTGDTLFVGDVGRPDLLDGKMTKEELSSMMYDSLKKLKALPDETLLYPGHGPGSSCGKNIGKETWSTLGQQKKTNYALQEMTREEFIKAVTTGLSAPPQYFFKDAMINKNGYDSIEEVMKRNTKALSADEVKSLLTNGAIILDTRTPDDFEKGFIPNAINIGLNGSYAQWLGTVVSIDTPLIVVADEGKAEESISRAARVGYENIKGYLKGGMKSWTDAGNKTETINSISAQEFAERIKSGEETILDVRKPGEWEGGHVVGAEHVCLSKFPAAIDSLDKNKTYLVHCAGGYRSMIAASMMKAKGFDKLINIYGGFGKIKETSVPIESSPVLA